MTFSSRSRLHSGRASSGRSRVRCPLPSVTLPVINTLTGDFRRLEAYLERFLDLTDEPRRSRVVLKSWTHPLDAEPGPAALIEFNLGTADERTDMRAEITYGEARAVARPPRSRGYRETRPARAAHIAAADERGARGAGATRSGIAAELASETGAFDQSSPSVTSLEPPGHFGARGEGAIRSAV